MVGGFFYMAENFADSIEWIHRQLVKASISNENMDSLDFSRLAYILRHAKAGNTFTTFQQQRLRAAVNRMLNDYDKIQTKISLEFLKAAQDWYSQC